MNSFKIKLHFQILISIIFGVIFGALLKENSQIFEPIGAIFISLLYMMMIPIIFTSLIIGITSINNIVNLGKLGSKTLIYYLSTTSLAVIIGLCVVNILEPGSGLNLVIENNTKDYLDVVKPYNFLENFIPKNIFQALTEENMIGIIIFTILFGIALNHSKETAKPILQLISSLNHVILKITEWIMKLSPIGVFALIATLIGNLGIDAFKPLIYYMLCVVTGLMIHICLILPSILYFLGNYKPKIFFIKFFPALATAFSTDSSIATLPITIETLEKKIKVSNKVSSFVASLGATINMDGTALYEAIAALFIAQAYNIELSLTSQLIVMTTAILASIGTAGIPSAGLVTLVMILQAVNLPIEGIAMLLAVDRILDMCRTTVNVAGDGVGAIIIAKLENEEISCD